MSGGGQYGVPTRSPSITPGNSFDYANQRLGLMPSFQGGAAGQYGGSGSRAHFPSGPFMQRPSYAPPPDVSRPIPQLPPGAGPQTGGPLQYQGPTGYTPPQQTGGGSQVQGPAGYPGYGPNQHQPGRGTPNTTSTLPMLGGVPSHMAGVPWQQTMTPGLNQAPVAPPSFMTGGNMFDQGRQQTGGAQQVAPQQAPQQPGYSVSKLRPDGSVNMDPLAGRDPYSVQQPAPPMPTGPQQQGQHDYYFGPPPTGTRGDQFGWHPQFGPGYKDYIVQMLSGGQAPWTNQVNWNDAVNSIGQLSGTPYNPSLWGR